MFLSHHANPPFGESITLNLKIKCRKGLTKVNLEGLKLHHHKNIVHKDGLIEFTGKDGIQRNLPFPSTSYHHHDKDNKLWVHLSIVDSSEFHGVIHFNGKAYVIEPSRHYTVPKKKMKLESHIDHLLSKVSAIL